LLLTLAGDATAGITCATQAIRLNPYHPGYYLSVLGACHFFSGNYAEAAWHVKKSPMDSLSITLLSPQHTPSRASRRRQQKRSRTSSVGLPRIGKEPPTARLITDMFVFKRKEDEALYFDGLRKAGLSE
jgi:hypothetical protein